MKTLGITQSAIFFSLLGWIVFSLAVPIGPVYRVKAGKQEFLVELADTKELQRRGLMNRESMPESHGLLMTFDYDRRVPIWMKNVLFPIDVAWLSSSGLVIDVKTLPVCNRAPCKVYYPVRPARFVLEVGAGLFQLKRGDKVEIIDASGDSLLPPVSGAGKHSD